MRSYIQQMALKRLIHTNTRVSIKDALSKLSAMNNKLLIKRRNSTDTKIDNMLRMSDIKECNKILRNIND